MSAPKPLADIIRSLAEYSTCDVADALLKLKVPNGGFIPGLTMFSPTRRACQTKIIGPAYTVRYVPKTDETSPRLQGHYIDSVPAGHVVLVSAPKVTNALYGGLMSTRAKHSGAAGTIVDGRIRDLQEHLDLEYPVFARDLGTTAPQEKLRVGATNVPVTIQNREAEDVTAATETTVNPGDILIADANGVVVLDQTLAERAVELIASQVEADGRIAADIQKGRTFAEASKEHRANVKMP